MGEIRKKLSLKDRRNIQGGLDGKLPVAEIARNIGRSQGTVRDEIRRHITDQHPGYMVLNNRNLCAKREKCLYTKNVWDCPMKDQCPGGQCRTCRLMNCNTSCPDCEIVTCSKHERSPFTCHGCDSLKNGTDCGHPYRFYIAEIADTEASELQSSSRKNLCVSGEDLVRINNAVVHGFSNKQSLTMIWYANPWMADLCSISTLYRWYNEELFDGVTLLDSPETVKRRTRKKPRKGEYAHSCIAKEDLEGRRHEDFKKLDENTRLNAAQMDTVKGRQGKDKQCILTFQWKRFYFQLYVLLPDCTAKSVVAALDMLQEVYGESYGKWFGTLLTDQGPEFSDVEGMEVNRETGEIRGSVYFCDAFRSQQKANAERQHEELRDVLEKGVTIFDALKPEDMATLTSHVNSYLTKSLDGMSALDVIWPCMGKELAKMGIRKIDPVNVCKSRWLIPHAMVPGTEPGKKPLQMLAKSEQGGNGIPGEFDAA